MQKLGMGIAIVALSLITGTAHAQSNCDGGITKAQAEKILCKALVFSKMQKRGAGVTDDDSDRLQKCTNRFTQKCEEAKAFGDCVSQTQNCPDLAAEADTSVTDITGSPRE